MDIRVHSTAEVSSDAKIGSGTSIWHQSQIREGVSIGNNCVISKGVYIDFDVQIGNNVKIQNYVSVFHGVQVGNGVFIGPHVCFTNDLNPRAVNSDGSIKDSDDWTLSQIHIKDGAAIGANSTIIAGITIGRWSMIGAGSVVTKDVPDYGLAFGSPARLRGFVDQKGNKLQKVGDDGDWTLASAEDSELIIKIPTLIWNSTHD